jgi:AraC-like DNA-binding protein
MTLKKPIFRENSVIPMQQINDIIQIITATLLGLVCLLLAKHVQSGRHSWTGIGLTLSILCYVTIESEAIQAVTALRIIAAIGAISIPVFFWLLSRAIFDDHFKFVPSLLIWFAVILIPHFDFFLSGLIQSQGFEQVTSILARLTSLGFVLAGLYTALKTKQADLIDSRIRFRNIFIIVTATLITLTLIAEVVPIEKETVVALQVLQRTSIFAITLYFLLSTFGLRAGFFFKEIAKPKATPVDDPILTNKLQLLMDEQKIYKKEGLTIGELAELMNEQEYRLRKLINGQLGFRNFNDFLSQYRINDACEILSDPTQTRKTILEIAYELGYQSIGPFNKAFKDLKGQTPTAYRKTQIND